MNRITRISAEKCRQGFTNKTGGAGNKYLHSGSEAAQLNTDTNIGEILEQECQGTVIVKKEATQDNASERPLYFYGANCAYQSVRIFLFLVSRQHQRVLIQPTTQRLVQINRVIQTQLPSLDQCLLRREQVALCIKLIKRG